MIVVVLDLFVIACLVGVMDCRMFLSDYDHVLGTKFYSSNISYPKSINISNTHIYSSGIKS
jgi:hypothetical protein